MTKRGDQAPSCAFCAALRRLPVMVTTVIGAAGVACYATGAVLRCAGTDALARLVTEASASAAMKMTSMFFAMFMMCSWWLKFAALSEL
jgi:hypothetical protein